MHVAPVRLHCTAMPVFAFFISPCISPVQQTSLMLLWWFSRAPWNTSFPHDCARLSTFTDQTERCISFISCSAMRYTPVRYRVCFSCYSPPPHFCRQPLAVLHFFVGTTVHFSASCIFRVPLVAVLSWRLEAAVLRLAMNNFLCLITTSRLPALRVVSQSKVRTRPAFFCVPCDTISTISRANFCLHLMRACISALRWARRPFATLSSNIPWAPWVRHRPCSNRYRCVSWAVLMLTDIDPSSSLHSSRLHALWAWVPFHFLPSLPFSFRMRFKEP